MGTLAPFLSFLEHMTNRTILTLPPDFQRRITEAGGRNLYGEPLFRIVWGWSRMAWIGGKFEGETDRNGNLLPAYECLTREPKYLDGLDQWHLEVWCPPDRYGSPESWPEEALGPFPARGDYERLTSFGPRSLTPALLERLVQFVMHSKQISTGERRTALLAAEEAKERQFDRDADDILSDVPLTYLRPHIVVPSTYKESPA